MISQLNSRAVGLFILLTPSSGRMTCLVLTEDAEGLILASRIVIKTDNVYDPDYEGIVFPVGLGINRKVMKMLLAAEINSVYTF